MKTVFAFGRQSLRPLSLFGGILMLITLFWPKLQAFWNMVNKEDPLLELLAMLLVVVILVGILAIMAHIRPFRQRT